MDPKRAAAIAGVMRYLQLEADAREEEAVRMGVRSSSGWSAHGRKAVARGRRIVQRRLPRRSLADATASRGYRDEVARPRQLDTDSKQVQTTGDAA